MHWLAFALLLVLGIIIFINWVQRAGTNMAQKVLYAIAIVIVAWAALILVIRSGSAIFALLPLLIPLGLRFWAAYKQAKTMAGGGFTPYPPDYDNNSSQQQHSTVATKYFNMTLNHASGEMDGTILQGRFTNRHLSSLSLTELLELWRFCQDEPQSVAVLEAFLDRYHDSEWREDFKSKSKHQASAATDDAEMTVQEAYDLLGLAPGATEKEIKAAHRRLMQRVHPDHGGSDYLAIRVNEAKSILLSLL